MWLYNKKKKINDTLGIWVPRNCGWMYIMSNSIKKKDVRWAYGNMSRIRSWMPIMFFIIKKKRGGKTQLLERN